MPQEEVTHRRLASLQNKLVHTCVTQILLHTFPSSTYALFLSSLEHTAGLNPKGFRIFRPTTQYFTHQRCDSNLIWILEEGLTFSFAGAGSLAGCWIASCFASTTGWTTASSAS